MTKIRLRFVQAFVVQGRPYYYFRKPGCARIKLPGLPGSESFMSAYQHALAAVPPPIGESKRSLPGSVSAAIAGYYNSPSFKALTGSTPSARRAVLERFRERHGTLPIGGMERRHILALLDGIAPFAARNWLKAIRGLVRHCLDHEIIRQDPTHGIRLLHPKGDGIHCWSEEEIAQFEAHFPVGTKARLALALGLYTAQRRGDVVKLGPQHIRDGVLTLRQQKTRASLSIPLHPELQAILNARPGSHLTFLVTKTNKSYAPQDFSKQFRAWCDEAGLPPECSFHGLRKAALTRLADAGCTVHQIAAVSGHKTLRKSSDTPQRSIRLSWRARPWCAWENKSGRKVSNTPNRKCQSH
jgi:integrase